MHKYSWLLSRALSCAELYPTLWQPHGLQSVRLLCPWDFPGKITGVGCHFLLQGIFPTQRLNLPLLHWQVDSSPGKPLSCVGPLICGFLQINLYYITTLCVVDHSAHVKSQKWRAHCKVIYTWILDNMEGQQPSLLHCSSTKCILKTNLLLSKRQGTIILVIQKKNFFKKKLS